MRIVYWQRGEPCDQSGNHFITMGRRQRIGIASLLTTLGMGSLSLASRLADTNHGEYELPGAESHFNVISVTLADGGIELHLNTVRREY